MRQNNMKNKILLILLLILLSLPLLSTDTVSAESATPSADLKIQELKDKLASRVAELALVSQKVLGGEIKTLSDEKIIIVNDGRETDLNLKDDTTFLEILRDYTTDKIKLDNLKTGQNIFSYGAFNNTTNSLNAQSVIFLHETFKITGKIKKVDSDNYQLLVSSNGTDVLIDHLTTTKDYLLDKNNKFVRGGFSKFENNQLVYAVGAYDEDKNKNKLFSAVRIIILPDTDASSSDPSPTPVK